MWSFGGLAGCCFLYSDSGLIHLVESVLTLAVRQAVTIRNRKQDTTHAVLKCFLEYRFCPHDISCWIVGDSGIHEYCFLELASV